MTTNSEDSVRAKMADLAQKQVTLQAEFARLLQDPTASSAANERAQREINRVGPEQTRLVAELRIARWVCRTGKRSLVRSALSTSLRPTDSDAKEESC